ncbi:MAG TPA: hypothetical protein VD838_14425 [Anaeromyxobacteraceae bacterium]|nr:hypothetical protein [Anaeromyxobacteraceae bacterium]
MKLSPVDYRIPPTVAAPLIRYVTRGEDPGPFLRDVLEGRAADVADVTSITGRHLVSQVVQWMWNEAPRECHGTPEAVREWIARGGRDGRFFPAAGGEL